MLLYMSLRELKQTAVTLNHQVSNLEIQLGILLKIICLHVYNYIDDCFLCFL